jgi:tetratricopeptide (TPR) repeat protein
LSQAIVRSTIQRFSRRRPHQIAERLRISDELTTSLSRCSAAALRPDFRQGRDAGYQLCEQALQIDQKNVLALTLLSLALSYRVINFASSEPQADIRRADELASLAIEFDPDFFLTHIAKASVLLPQGRYRDAIDAYQRALSLGLSNVDVYTGLATAYNFLGEPEEAIAYVDKAMRINFRDPFAVDMCNTKVMAYGIMRNYEEALRMASPGRGRCPG